MAGDTPDEPDLTAELDAAEAIIMGDPDAVSAGRILVLDRELRYLLGGHACALPGDTLSALAQLAGTIGKVLAEASGPSRLP
jgi:hypothetical protein